MPIRVVARVRPLSTSEVSRGETSILDVVDESRLVAGGVPFQFDAVFGERSSHDDVFGSISHLTDEVLEGKNGTVLAYGQTGSGKSYSMGGLGYRAVGAVFDALRAGGLQFSACASYLEIYNETVRDVFASNETIKLRSGRDGLAQVNDATFIGVESAEDARACLRVGMESRETSATDCNQQSSRSHGIFELKIQIQRKTGRLILVDLAGSENAERTGEQGDKRRLEAKAINQSLLALGQVITALSSHSAPHIPFRNSTLTRLLQASLSQSTTVFLGCVSPAKSVREETLSTLRYAERAGKISTSSRVKFVLPEASPQIVLRLETDLARSKFENALEETAAMLTNEALALAVFETEGEDHVDKVTKLEALAGSRARALAAQADKTTRFEVANTHLEWTLKMTKMASTASLEAVKGARRADNDAQTIETEKELRRADFESAQHDLTLAQQECIELRATLQTSQADKDQVERSLAEATVVIATLTRKVDGMKAESAEEVVRHRDELDAALTAQRATDELAKIEAVDAQRAKDEENFSQARLEAERLHQEQRAILRDEGVAALTTQATEFKQKLADADAAHASAISARDQEHAGAVCILRQTHQDKLAALESEQETIRRNEVEAALASQATEHANALESAAARHDALAADKMAQALEALKREHETVLEASRRAKEEEFASALEAQNEQHATSLKLAETSYKEKLDEDRRSQQAENEASLEAARRDAANELDAALASKAAEFEASMSALRQRASGELEEALAKQAAEHLAAVEKLRRESSEQLATVETDANERARQDSAKKLEDALAKQAAEHSAAIEALHRESAERLTAAEADAKELARQEYAKELDEALAKQAAERDLELSSRVDELRTESTAALASQAKEHEKVVAELRQAYADEAAARALEEEEKTADGALDAALAAHAAAVECARIEHSVAYDREISEAQAAHREELSAAVAAASALSTREAIAEVEDRTNKLESELRARDAEIEYATQQVAQAAALKKQVRILESDATEQVAQTAALENQVNELKKQLEAARSSSRKDEEIRKFSGINQANTPVGKGCGDNKRGSKTATRLTRQKEAPPQAPVAVATDYRRKLRSSARGGA